MPLLNLVYRYHTHIRHQCRPSSKKANRRLYTYTYTNANANAVSNFYAACLPTKSTTLYFGEVGLLQPTGLSTPPVLLLKEYEYPMLK